MRAVRDVEELQHRGVATLDLLLEMGFLAVQSRHGPVDWLFGVHSNELGDDVFLVVEDAVDYVQLVLDVGDLAEVFDLAADAGEVLFCFLQLVL